MNKKTKHIFIINPSAGSRKIDLILGDIHAIWGTSGEDYEIYETRHSTDAEGFVRKRCMEFEGECSGSDIATSANSYDSLRFYACGGDGTLNEVVNGAYGFDFVEVGCIPTGTGNDFVRNFPDSDFTDMLAQFRGNPTPCDLIKYETTFIPDDNTVSRYCVNMFNIGFDCAVVDTTDHLKKLPLIGGSFAYLSSVMINLVEKTGADLVVVYPDGSIHNEKILLLSIANGCFCGGGIKGLPRARTDDGLMDVSLVRNVSRRTFISLFPKYQKGTHLEDPRVAAFLRYSQEPSLTVFPSEGNLKLCVDGEIYETGPVNFTMMPGAFRFVIP